MKVSRDNLYPRTHSRASLFLLLSVTHRATGAYPRRLARLVLDLAFALTVMKWCISNTSYTNHYAVETPLRASQSCPVDERLLRTSCDT